MSINNETFNSIGNKRILTFKRISTLIGILYKNEQTREDIINNELFKGLWDKDIDEDTLYREITRLLKSIKGEFKLEVNTRIVENKKYYIINDNEKNKHILTNYIFPVILRKYLYDQLPIFNINSLINTSLKPADNYFLSMIIILNSIKDKSIVKMEYIKVGYFISNKSPIKKTYYIIPIDLIFRSNEWVLLALDVNSYEKDTYTVGKRFYIGGIESFTPLNKDLIEEMKNNITKPQNMLSGEEYKKKNKLINQIEKYQDDKIKLSKHQPIEEIFKDSIGIYVSGEKSFDVKIKFTNKNLLHSIKNRPKLCKWNITEGKDSFTLNTQVSSLYEMADWVFQFGNTAEILYPEELKTILINKCNEVVSSYSQTID